MRLNINWSQVDDEDWVIGNSVIEHVEITELPITQSPNYVSHKFTPLILPVSQTIKTKGVPSEN